MENKTSYQSFSSIPFQTEQRFFRAQSSSEAPPQFPQQCVAPPQRNSSSTLLIIVIKGTDESTRVQAGRRSSGKLKPSARPLLGRLIIQHLSITQLHWVHQTIENWEIVLHSVCHVQLPMSLPKEMSGKL